jgi:hypothetical protein
VTIHDDVISHVNVSNLREEDGGEYTCTARNAVAQVSHSARINVYGLPFIRPMPRITAVAGSDLVVKCPVAGHPIESITWERGTVCVIYITLAHELLTRCIIPILSEWPRRRSDAAHQ